MTNVFPSKARNSHSTVSIVISIQLFKQSYHRLTHKNKITGEPVWVPGRLQRNRRAQMGKAKHTRISQRMSQHIMQLKLALPIMASEAKPIKMICL